MCGLHVCVLVVCLPLCLVKLRPYVGEFVQCELYSKYLSVCVGFLYTSIERDPLLRVTKVSKNESFSSSSCSNGNVWVDRVK